MSLVSQDFAKLSYKELQALALKNQIPGNIKKSLLVDCLRALKCGNKVQVSRMLVELKENRKRKVRKRKLERLEKMTALTSTPLHSPNYSSIEPQRISPYRWATPDEAVKREDPHYEMFRQLLLQRIQNCQNFDSNNNDTSEVDSAGLNLKASALESNSRTNVFTNPIASNTFLTSPVLEAQSAGQQFAESQFEINENDSNFRPMILQKMLQAPLGTNLGAMARIEASRMWPVEHYRSLRNIDDNNSDTITADSESLDGERDERTDCYIFDNRRSQPFFSEQTPIPQISLDQMMSYLQNNNHNGYQNLAASNAQENCQTWIENSLDYRGPVDYTETGESSRIYSSLCVEDQANYQFQSDGNLTAFGQNNPTVENSLPVQNLSSYYQIPSQQVHPYRGEFYEPVNSSGVCNNSSLFSANVAHFNTMQAENFGYGIYPQECSTSVSYAGVENFQYSINNQNQGTNQPASYSVNSTLTQVSGEENIPAKSLSQDNVQKRGNNLADTYWPLWSQNTSAEFGLENILNLNTGRATDYTKFNQTSSVYCFAPPLSSPLSGTSSSQNFERAEHVPAGRFHAFMPNSLVYSDSTTGMRMARLTELIADEAKSEDSSETVEYKSENGSHPEPIQEIWIPDFDNQGDNGSNDFLSSSCETIPE